MTTDFFITLLSDFLNKRETEQPEDINWAELMRVAKLHEMAGTVYYQCKKYVPAEYQESINAFSASTFFYYANRVNEEQIALQKLRDAGVRCFILKGTAAAIINMRKHLFVLLPVIKIYESIGVPPQYCVNLQSGV